MDQKQSIELQIRRMERKLKETIESFEWNRGPANDALKIVVPMLEDQLAIMREIVKLLP